MFVPLLVSQSELFVTGRKLLVVLSFAAFSVLGAVRVAMPVPTGSESGSTQQGAWTDSHCGSCHRVEPQFSHPLGVSPAVLPVGLPLSADGVTCVTCHVDGSMSAHVSAARDGTAMLREPVPLLCSRCHDVRSGARADYHAGLLLRAHLKRPAAVASKTAPTVPELADSRDARCLVCHDGTVARDASAGSRLRGAAGPGRTHPIGTQFPGVGDPDGRHVYRVSLVDSRIRLFDGEVRCASCHSLFSRHDALLVIPNRYSRLCLSCHDS